MALILDGCTLTRNTVSRAKPIKWDAEKSDYVPDERQPAYYLLVPFAFVGDVVATPVYVAAWCGYVWHETHQ